MKNYILSRISTLRLFDIWEGINKDEYMGKDQITILVKNIATIALQLVSTVALLFLIIGGIQYITSAGNPDNTARAKQTLLYAVIGLILVISSYAIIVFVTTSLK
jgi:hypothetical protein